MNNANMQFINVNDIHPHRDNPRKDLGDLSELSDSIRINGVMQNLTIIPNIDGLANQYTVVIGHRRLAAAKIAGIDIVPCVVTEMDERQQISTMLLENMQRTDLTVLEQAEGMQMMMDLGDSVKEICQKTGFAETTVRHRLKITELDKDTVKKCIKKQIGINDFIKLEKIKDIDTRNELAKHLGTGSFDWKYKSVLEDQEWSSRKAEIIEELLTYAEQFDVEDDVDTSTYRYVSAINKYHADTWKAPDDKNERDYFFQLTNYDAIRIYNLRAEDKEEDKKTNTYVKPEPTPEEIEEERILRLAEELTERAFELRKDYILNRRYSLDDMTVIISGIIKLGLEDEVAFAYAYRWMEYLGLDKEEFGIEHNSDLKYEMIKDMVEKNPMKYLAIAFVAGMDDEDNSYYRTWPDFEHCENELMDEIYEFLISLGYEMSDDEKQLQDGTHEIFTGTGEDDE